MTPQLGSEQAGYRPAVVVSNRRLNAVSDIILLCPITNSSRNYPSHVKLPDSMKTTGEIMCEQLKAVDISVRPYKHVENLPKDVLEEMLETIRYITEEV